MKTKKTKKKEKISDTLNIRKLDGYTKSTETRPGFRIRDLDGSIIIVPSYTITIYKPKKEMKWG
jgi:hypothetical protein